MADEDEIVLSVFSLYYRYLSVDETNGDMTPDGFGVYLTFARDELSRQLSSRGIPEDALTENEERIALCHLIADNFEQGNPDWNFSSQSQAPGVSFSRREESGPRSALNKLLDSVELAVKRSGSNGGRRITLSKITDSSHYPKRFKRSDIPSFDPLPDGFDENEVVDTGSSIYDQNQNTW